MWLLLHPAIQNHNSFDVQMHLSPLYSVMLKPLPCSAQCFSCCAKFVSQTRSCVGEPVDQVNEEEHKAGMVSFCCIDWPSLVNVTLLRLWKLRRALQDQATDTYASTSMASSKPIAKLSACEARCCIKAKKCCLDAPLRIKPKASTKPH